MHCWNGFDQICRRDAPLSEFTWYRVGGPARWMFTPRDEQELARLLLRCNDQGVQWRMLGLGANILVSDRGFDGAVIRLSGRNFELFSRHDELIDVAAGARMTDLVKHAAQRGWSGLERLAGVPGTLGGLIRMNAGGTFGCIDELVRDVRVVDSSGEFHTLSCEQVGFGYRSSKLDGCVVTGARLRCPAGDPQETQARYLQIWREKFATQPPLKDRSSGCIFQNPPGQKAGRLIEQAGLKGRREGGAVISDLHANFIVANKDDQARADDILRLINVARDGVRRAHGVELELEVQVW